MVHEFSMRQEVTLFQDLTVLRPHTCWTRVGDGEGEAEDKLEQYKKTN